MYKKRKNRSFFSVSLSLIIIASCLAGFFHSGNEVAGIYHLFNRSDSYNTAGINLNRNLAGDNSSHEPARESQENDNFHNLFFLLVSIAFLNRAGSIFSLIITSVLFISRTGASLKERSWSHLSRLRHYRAWCLDFISPVQKCILNRADVYDINPVDGFSRVNNPCFGI